MSWLCAYSQLAKNPHDDAPDMVSVLAVYQSGRNIAAVKIMPQPFEKEDEYYESYDKRVSENLRIFGIEN